MEESVPVVALMEAMMGVPSGFESEGTAGVLGIFGSVSGGNSICFWIFVAAFLPCDL